MVRNICTAAIALLVGVPGLVAGQNFDAYDLAMRTLRQGDIVDVRDWNGRAVKGRLVEQTACSLTVATDRTQIEIPGSGTKTVKRIRRAEPPDNRLADAGNKCENAACMAATLAFAGTTAVTRGVQKLFTRSELVYRASHPTEAPLRCAPENTLSATRRRP